MTRRFQHDDDRRTFPRLVVGRSYRHRKLGHVKILAVLPNMHFDGCRYSYQDASGQPMGEQNDFALLNSLISVPPLRDQLILF